MTRGLDSDDVVVVSHRRITLSSALNLGGRLLGIAMGIAVAAMLARSLTRASFGTFSLVLAVVCLAGNAADFGLGQTAPFVYRERALI